MHGSKKLRSLDKKAKQYKCSVCGRFETINSVRSGESDIVDDFPAPKILVLDIETAPSIAYVWDIWEQNIWINQIEKNWHILCWAAKWLGEEQIICDSLPQHPAKYKKNPEDDSSILIGMWKLLDEADVVITHNGDKFDVPKLNTRFILAGMTPPSPYRSIDTLKVARGVFEFTSNKLAYISEFLGVGSKMETGGFSLWKGCLSGDKESWNSMVTYNANDVSILEAVYFKLRPWVKNHPNLGLFTDKGLVCVACGSSDVAPVEGKFVYTNASKFQCYLCDSCGKFMRGRKSLTTKEERKSLLA